MSLCGVTCSQSKKAKIKATKKAKYDYETHLDRFPRVNIVHYDSFFVILRPFFTSEAMQQCVLQVKQPGKNQLAKQNWEIFSS